MKWKFFITAALMLSLAHILSLGARQKFPFPSFPNVPQTENSLLGKDAGITLYETSIIRTLPHAGNKKFTQGLEIYQGRLYESTGLFNKSALKKISLETGEVILQKNLPDYFAEGLTIREGKIYNLSWQKGKLFVYAAGDFEEYREIYSYDSEGWGLSKNGSGFIMSDGSDKLYFRSFKNFSLLKTLSVTLKNQPVYNLNELEYAKGALYANIWLKNEIYIINLENGKVQGIVDTGNLRDCQVSENGEITPNGIAYHAQSETFYLTGKNCPFIYEVRFVEK